MNFLKGATLKGATQKAQFKKVLYIGWGGAILDRGNSGHGGAILDNVSPQP